MDDRNDKMSKPRGNPNWIKPKSDQQKGVEARAERASEAVQAFNIWLKKHAVSEAKKALLECLASEDEHIKMKATELVLNRYLGKPRQEITGSGGGPIVMGLVVLPAEQPIPAIDVTPVLQQLVESDEEE